MPAWSPSDLTNNTFVTTQLSDKDRSTALYTVTNELNSTYSRVASLEAELAIAQDAANNGPGRAAINELKAQANDTTLAQEVRDAAFASATALADQRAKLNIAAENALKSYNDAHDYYATLTVGQSNLLNAGAVPPGTNLFDLPPGYEGRSSPAAEVPASQNPSSTPVTTTEQLQSASATATNTPDVNNGAIGLGIDTATIIAATNTAVTTTQSTPTTTVPASVTTTPATIQPTTNNTTTTVVGPLVTTPVPTQSFGVSLISNLAIASLLQKPTVTNLLLAALIPSATNFLSNLFSPTATPITPAQPLNATANAALSQTAEQYAAEQQQQYANLAIQSQTAEQYAAQEAAGYANLAIQSQTAEQYAAQEAAGYANLAIQSQTAEQYAAQEAAGYAQLAQAQADANVAAAEADAAYQLTINQTAEDYAAQEAAGYANLAIQSQTAEQYAAEQQAQYTQLANDTQVEANAFVSSTNNSVLSAIGPKNAAPEPVTTASDPATANDVTVLDPAQYEIPGALTPLTEDEKAAYKNYVLAPIDPKEDGAIMGTMIVSEGATEQAQIDIDTNPELVRSIINAQPPSNPVAEATLTPDASVTIPDDPAVVPDPATSPENADPYVNNGQTTIPEPIPQPDPSSVEYVNETDRASDAASQKLADQKDPSSAEYISEADRASDAASQKLADQKDPASSEYVSETDRASDAASQQIANQQDPSSADYISEADRASDAASQQIADQKDPSSAEYINEADRASDAASQKIADNTASNPSSQGATKELQSKATKEDSASFQKAKDWRVRISLAPSAKYLYKGVSPAEAGILEPLQATDGVIFPYTPNVSVSYAAGYDPTDIAHSNYKIFQYKGSSVDSISITGDFTAQDTSEANYMLAVIHFFRSVTKMFYGQDQNPKNGVPPPLVYLSGFGSFQFDNHPMAITNFTYSTPTDVDYIRAGSQTNMPGQSVATQTSVVNSTATAASAVRLLTSNLTAKAPNFQSQNTAINSNATYVPTKISITITALPVVTRNDISNNFSLKKYGTGELLQGSKRPSGGGIW